MQVLLINLKKIQNSLIPFGVLPAFSTQEQKLILINVAKSYITLSCLVFTLQRN